MYFLVLTHGPRISRQDQGPKNLPIDSIIAADGRIFICKAMPVTYFKHFYVQGNDFKMQAISAVQGSAKTDFSGFKTLPDSKI
jgi:hypothetical protein